MISYLAIINPASGRGQARHRLAALLRELPGSCRIEVAETEHRGEAAAIAALRAMDVDRIIAVGGDGTLNEVLSGLVGTGHGAHSLPELGFLPAGTANAAIRAFGFTRDPGAFARSLLEANSRPVDVGIVSFGGGKRAFLLWIGAGFDAVVIDALNTSRTGRMGLSGLLRRFPRVVASLGRYAAPRIEIAVDGSPFGVAASVIMANVGEMAFGAVVAETANPFDGRLDVVAVPPGSRLNLVRLAWRMMTSSLSQARGVRQTLGTHIRLDAEGRVPFQLDGEPAGVLPATVRLESGAVRLFGCRYPKKTAGRFGPAVR